jgi:hypothetical protein
LVGLLSLKHQARRDANRTFHVAFSYESPLATTCVTQAYYVQPGEVACKHTATGLKSIELQLMCHRDIRLQHTTLAVVQGVARDEP